MTKALITGITGQDGSYLAEFLLDKGYKVVGMVRRSSSPNTSKIDHIKNKLILEPGDLADQSSIDHIIRKYQPDEIYNLAAQSFVQTSWKTAEYTANIDALGVLRLLESIRQFTPDTKFYQASTSEMFGKVVESPQNENTKFYPRSPYGVSKVFAHYITINYRESYNLFASCGILFNHESPRRGLEFVTRKITNTVAKIALGKTKELRLGNLDAKRDWGFAGDYVEAMYEILQYKSPDTFVIGTERNTTVREFCNLAFNYVGLNYTDYVIVDPEFYRPAEVEVLLSNCTKAKAKLNWKPKHSLRQLVEMMVENDLREESKND
jgi:GDPmannose 4,6-dehydratase